MFESVDSEKGIASDVVKNSVSYNLPLLEQKINQDAEWKLRDMKKKALKDISNNHYVNRLKVNKKLSFNSHFDGKDSTYSLQGFSNEEDLDKALVSGFKEEIIADLFSTQKYKDRVRELLLRTSKSEEQYYSLQSKYEELWNKHNLLKEKKKRKGKNK